MNEPGWVILREYASQMEADLDIGILDRNGVPFQVQGPPIGIFGPGFSGATAAGVRLLVPDDRADEADEPLGDQDVDEPA
jgi:hypothetical protein